MYSKLQKFIIEELDEVGEVPLTFIIPYYLRLEKDIEIKYPISENSDNYLISNEDFEIAKRQLNELVSEIKLGLFKYKGKDINKGIRNWEDAFDQLSNDQWGVILENKNVWFNTKEGSVYFIAVKE